VKSRSDLLNQEKQNKNLFWKDWCFESKKQVLVGDGSAVPPQFDLGMRSLDTFSDCGMSGITGNQQIKPFSDSNFVIA